MAKIIPIRKPEPEPVVHKWVGHKCANYEYYLRDDGVIICVKCGEETGYWQPKG